MSVQSCTTSQSPAKVNLSDHYCPCCIAILMCFDHSMERGDKDILEKLIMPLSKSCENQISYDNRCKSAHDMKPIMTELMKGRLLRVMYFSQSTTTEINRICQYITKSLAVTEEGNAMIFLV